MATAKGAVRVVPSAVQPLAGGSAASDKEAEANSASAALRPQLMVYKESERLREEQAATGLQILPRQKLLELVKQIDKNQTIEAEVEELLLEMTNDFIERVVTFSCQLAKHRGSDVLEAKDVQLHLERNWNIRVPGAGRDEVRVGRAPKTTDMHKTRIGAVNKAIESDAKRRKTEA